MTKFQHGNTYYHYAHPAEEFDRNFRLMTGMGINAVRVAEIWPGWSVIAPQENVYDYTDLDKFVELAGQSGMEVCMGVGINDTPFWCYYKYDGLRQKGTDGKISDRRVQTACFDHAEYRKDMAKFIHNITVRYANNPTVTSFQIGNEVRYNVSVCNCPATQKRFRKWLKDIYAGDITAINKEWGVYYANFDQIYPYASPDGAPTRGIATHYLMTKKFQNWALEELISSGAEIIRQYTNKPVFHNCWGVPNMSGSNFKFAESCDIAVIDIYAVTYGNPCYYQGLPLDMTRTIAGILQKPFWVGETPAGQYGTYERIPADQKLVELNVIEHIASGAKAVYYFRHKAPKYEQPHKFTGSQPFIRTDESEMDYVQTPKLVKRLMELYEDRFMTAKNIKSEIAMIYPTDSLLLGSEAGYGKANVASVYGARAMLASSCRQIDVLDTQMLKMVNLHDYKMITLPMAYLFDYETAQLLMDYVAYGGILVSEGRPAYVDKDGWLYDHQPGAGLNELFGADEDLFFNIPEYNISIQNAEYSLDIKTKIPFLKQTYRNLQPSAKPFATDEEGNICGVINSYGKGKAIILGGLPSLYFDIGSGKYDAGTSKGEDECIDAQRVVYSQLYAKIAETAGVKPSVILDKPNVLLTTKVLESASKQLIFLINYSKHQSTAVSINSKKLTELTQDGEKPIISNLEIPPMSYKIISTT